MPRSWTTGMTGLICLACCGCQTGSSGIPQFSTGGSAAISGSTSLGAVTRPQPVQVSQSINSPTDDSAVIIEPGDTLRMHQPTPARLTPVTGAPPALLPVTFPTSADARRKTVQVETTRLPGDIVGVPPVQLTGQQQRLPPRQRSSVTAGGPDLTVEMLESNRPLATVVTPRQQRSTAERTSVQRPTIRPGASSTLGKVELQIIREKPLIRRLPPVPADGLSRNLRLPQEPIPVYPEVQPPMRKVRRPSREDL